MKNVVLNILIGFFYVFGVGSCASSFDTHSLSSDREVIPLSKIYNNPEEYVGSVISVRGYLTPTIPDLILYESKSSAKAAHSPILLIYDSTPQQSLGDAFSDLSLNCTNKNVEITGNMSFLEILNAYGMERITRLVVFEGDNFAGIGTLCYEVQDIK